MSRECARARDRRRRPRLDRRHRGARARALPRRRARPNCWSSVVRTRVASSGFHAEGTQEFLAGDRRRRAGRGCGAPAGTGGLAAISTGRCPAASTRAAARSTAAGRSCGIGPDHRGGVAADAADDLRPLVDRPAVHRDHDVARLQRRAHLALGSQFTPLGALARDGGGGDQRRHDQGERPDADQGGNGPRRHPPLARRRRRTRRSRRTAQARPPTAASTTVGSTIVTRRRSAHGWSGVIPGR